MAEANKIKYTVEFEKLLDRETGKWGPAMEYLYEHRNDMSKEEFEDCVIAYGHAVYDWG